MSTSKLRQQTSDVSDPNYTKSEAFHGMHGLGPLACRNLIPSNHERVGLQSILDIQSKVLVSLDEAIVAAETASKEALQQCQKLWQEVESAQTKLASSQRAVETLRSQRNLLSNELQGLRGLLHPVRRIPREILAYIFELVANPVRTPLLLVAMRLSHVCRTWRNVAVNHPPLWTTIKIDLEKPLSRFYWIRDVLLSRSGRQSLSLEIVYDGEKITETVWKKLAMMDVGLVGSLKVKLHKNCRQMFDEIINSYKSHTDSIKELELSCTFYTEQDEEIMLAYFFNVSAGEALPFVEKLTLNYVGGVDFNFKNDLPRLKCLHISGTHRIPLLSVILRCPSLEEVTLSGAQRDITNLENEGVELEYKVVRPIRILSVEYGSTLDLLAENIEMPHIKSITISHRILSDPGELFSDLLELNHLSVCDLRLGVWEDLVLAAPNIKTLCVGGPSGVKIIANWEEAIDSTEPPFKSLETLEISLYEDYIDLDSFNKLVERRCLSEELTQKTRDPDTVQLRTIVIESEGLWNPPVTKSWMDSQYLKYATTRHGWSSSRITWPS
ncbi:hypothetical protein FRC14_003302 [Serendipita sp. 396]|nr:hypothetical protein FRC14_003302 [Serendipita sp. 396]KAG8797192.1 hypothetical protein FRC16_009155 [Serendipita sp. 398]